MQTSTTATSAHTLRSEELCQNLTECINLIDRSFSRSDMSREDIQTLCELRVKCDQLRETIAHAATNPYTDIALYEPLYCSVPELTSIIRSELGRSVAAH